uniref:Rho-GAP domain-containing protein n=1 Tax=Steinernema glaseri TaxID=37863 RepID=A0A1I8AVC0_9BILA
MCPIIAVFSFPVHPLKQPSRPVKAFRFTRRNTQKRRVPPAFENSVKIANLVLSLRRPHGRSCCFPLDAMTVSGYGMVLCGNDEIHQRYRGRIEKVKFGVPLSEAFNHDIPATLLVLMLKVNKEAPFKKDVWRAPGNQAQVRKLSNIMQHGRLVNISNYSVYTAASVIKKFLNKLPGGIFGIENEKILFDIVTQPDPEKQRQVFCRVIEGMSVPTQHLLVLLFGTFRNIRDSPDSSMKMSSDAIGISVAPSLFHSCIHDNGRPNFDDVIRLRNASEVISKIIEGFGHTNLFPRECYEFYARITGRTLRIDENWVFTFQYPPSRLFSYQSAYNVMAAKCAGSYSLSAVTDIPSSSPGVCSSGGAHSFPQSASLSHISSSSSSSLLKSVSHGICYAARQRVSDNPPSQKPPPPPNSRYDGCAPSRSMDHQGAEAVDMHGSASCDF